jgi:hypothetical protein
MGNIIGEGFPERIINQVKIRQEIQGSGYNQSRTNEEIVYLTNNTAWCKLVSSTEIDDPKSLNNPTISQFGEAVKGNVLAKEFILFNGTSKIDEKGNQTLRGGIDYTDTLSGFGNAYGIGGSKDFGLRPMMGITSVSVKHKNRGSIRTATVNIKAWNKAQFEIIDILYLRVGFSVLIEWGNTMYFDSKKELQHMGPTNSLATEFLKGNAYDIMLDQIAAKRLETFGNYDAMFGKVTNFHWSFLADGSYDITVDLVSIGDVVESFKINAAPSTLNQIQTTGTAAAATNAPTLWDRLEAASNKHAIAGMMRDELKAAAIGSTPGGTFSTHPSPWYTIGGSQVRQSPGWTQANETIDFVLQSVKDQSVNAIDPSNPGAQGFVRLGYFLEWIQNNLLYRVSGKGKAASRIPILKFDTNPESNLMGIVKFDDPVTDKEGYPTGIVLNQMSYDPFVCMVFKELPLPSNTLGSTKIINLDSALDANSLNGTDMFGIQNLVSNGQTGQKLELFDIKIGDAWYGKIMNIYINIDFILNKLDSLTDEKNGKITLIDFLKNILDGVNGALGGINELDFIVDENTNTAKIIDKNPYPSPNSLLTHFNLPQDTVEFQMYGYDKTDPGSAGFVKDFKLTTELTPEYSTMITVAATANNSVVNEDATALSKLNKGLYDRYKENVEDINSNTTPTPTVFNPPPSSNNIAYMPVGANPTTPNLNVGPAIWVQTNPYQNLSLINTPDTYFRYLLAAFNVDATFQPSSQPDPNSFFQYLYLLQRGVWRQDWADTFKSQMPIIYQYWNQYLQYKSKGKPSDRPTFKTGFIPFNLSLTIDGLSGMKIYSKFSVNTDFLPSNYPDSIEFLIKNISHEIKDNKWTTQLESFCVSKPNVAVTGGNAPSSGGVGLGIRTFKIIDGDEYFDVTPTYDNKFKKEIITKYGAWPIMIKQEGGKFYGKVDYVDGKNSIVYVRNPDYAKNLTSVTYNGKIYKNIHKDVKDSLLIVLKKLDVKKLLSFVQSIDSGWYTRDVRNKVGKLTNDGNLSGHAFALSIDVNSGTFPQGPGGYNKYLDAIKAGDKKALVVKEFIDSNLFNWGGDFTNKDAHHFTIKPYNI